MAEKINVKCKSCGAIFHAMSDEVDQLRCPQCEGELEAADAAPLAEKENLEETVKEYSFSNDKTTPEEARKIKEQLLPPGGVPEIPAEEEPKPEQKAKAPETSKKEAPKVEDEKPVEKNKLPDAPAINLEAGDAEGLKVLAESYRKITGELEKVIVGQKAVIEEIMVAILAGGHCLLEGVPGLAKTLLIQSISEALTLSFKRIQFTPDLMPSDITGTDIIQDDPETGQRKFKFLPGPIFANIILADEINRTPPKTQAAMLEAMQEKQVSTGGGPSINWQNLFLYWRPRTPWIRKEHIRCRKRSRTVSCSKFLLIIRWKMKKSWSFAGLRKNSLVKLILCFQEMISWLPRNWSPGYLLQTL